jgi:dienelactone hydrolase
VSPTFALLGCLAVASAPPTATVPESPRESLGSPADVKAAFHRLIDRPRVPLDVKAVPTRLEHNGAIVSERLSFASERRGDGQVERVPALVVKSTIRGRGRRPAVIVLHGTGGSKDGMHHWLDDLARRGFVAIAIDARYHGERSGRAEGAAAYVAAITRAWRAKSATEQEHPFYYDTCWDVWRTVDYLETRGDVDPARIGVVGISMGGIETWLAASVDPRIAVAVPAISVQSFRWSLDNEAWQARAQTIRGAHDAAARDLGEPKVNARVCRELWGKVIPGILDEFDCPSMIRLFAPRPLLILSGEADPNCPIQGARIAFAAAESAYEAADARHRLRINVAHDAAHVVTPVQHRLALRWFVEWLKP